MMNSSHTTQVTLMRKGPDEDLPVCAHSLSGVKNGIMAIHEHISMDESCYYSDCYFL